MVPGRAQNQGVDFPAMALALTATAFFIYGLDHNHSVAKILGGIFLGAACDVEIADVAIEDNGDHDDYADTNETVRMRISLVNNCGIDLHNCRAWVFTNSPEVDCIVDADIDVGDLEDGAVPVLSDEGFVWKLADVNRMDVDDVFENRKVPEANPHV